MWDTDRDAMINGTDFIRIVKEFFQFLESEFGFSESDEKIDGSRFYSVRYLRGDTAISVSYENVEDYLLTIIYVLHNGSFPDYDDKTRTLHLEKLTAALLPNLNKSEFASNNELFQGYVASSELERKLLKSAKDLRLCLLHFSPGDGAGRAT